MSRSQQVRQLAESFIKALKEKYPALNEAEDSSQLPINPSSRQGRKAVIDFLQNPVDEDGIEMKVPADMQSALKIAQQIIDKGESARLNYNNLVGDTTDDTFMGTNPRTQNLTLALELLAYAYNTPDGEEIGYGLGVATPEIRKNIVDGFIGMFNPLDDRGGISVFGKMLMGDSEDRRLPLPYRVNPEDNKEYVDNRKIKQFLADAYFRIAEKIAKSFLSKDVDPSGKVRGNIEGKFENLPAYVVSSMRRAYVDAFNEYQSQAGDYTGVKGWGSKQAKGFSMDAGHLDRDAQGSGDSKMFYGIHNANPPTPLIDFSSKGNFGLQVLKDIYEEFKNPKSTEVYRRVLGDKFNVGKTKPIELDILRATIDSLSSMELKKVPVPKTKSNPDGFKEIMRPKYKDWTEFLKDIYQNPPEQYPALADYIKSANKIKKVEDKFTEFFGGRKFQVIRDFLYRTKYEKEFNPDAKGIKLSTPKKMAGPNFNLSALYKTDDPTSSGQLKKAKSWDPLSGEPEPEMGDDEKQYYVDPGDYDQYYAQMKEQTLFEHKLQEAVAKRLFDHMIKKALFNNTMPGI